MITVIIGATIALLSTVGILWVCWDVITRRREDARRKIERAREEADRRLAAWRAIEQQPDLSAYLARLDALTTASDVDALERIAKGYGTHIHELPKMGGYVGSADRWVPGEKGRIYVDDYDRRVEADHPEARRVGIPKRPRRCPDCTYFEIRDLCGPSQDWLDQPCRKHQYSQGGITR